MEQRRKLTNEEKYELLKMYYKEGRRDFTGTKFEGYNVPAMRMNLRAAYNASTLKMDPELIKKFEGRYFLQRERTKRTSDEEKYEFLIKFYEENPEADRGENNFSEKYKDGKKVRNYTHHLQLKHNKGKDTISQEQVAYLIAHNFLHYSPTEKEEMAKKYGISVEWIDDIQKKFGPIENFEKAIEEDIESLELPMKNRFIWKGHEDVSYSQKVGYVMLMKSTFKMEDPNLDCMVVDPKIIDEKIETLTWREKVVLKERFGLETGKPKLSSEVSQEFEISRERTRQIEDKALRKLRHPSKRREIDENMLSYNLKENMDKKKELEERIEMFEGNKTEYERKEAEDKLNEEIRALNRLKNINELGLTTRTYNCLHRKGIETVEELTKYTVEDIWKIRNMGRKSFAEILRKTRRIRNKIR